MFDIKVNVAYLWLLKEKQKSTGLMVGSTGLRIYFCGLDNSFSSRNTGIYICIHLKASGGYYGLCMSTPLLIRCQGFTGRRFKFAGYFHNHKILPGNILASF